MNLCVDIGNTNTVIGVFDKNKVIYRWRIATTSKDTFDDLKSRLFPLFIIEGVDKNLIKKVVVSSVVPMWNHSWERFCYDIFGIKPLFVGPGVKTGIRIALENPKEVGADRIVNSAAAIAQFPEGAIIVDSGTAITIDIVSPQKVYLGGTIMPGITMSLDALVAKTAKLHKISLEKPDSAIGKSTTDGIRAGIYFGFVGMIDRCIEEILKEIDFKPKIIATGGLAGEIAQGSKFIELYDRDLTLFGINLIAEAN